MSQMSFKQMLKFNKNILDTKYDGCKMRSDKTGQCTRVKTVQACVLRDLLLHLYKRQSLVEIKMAR
jgi:hypothetical protein